MEKWGALEGLRGIPGGAEMVPEESLEGLRWFLRDPWRG